MLIAFPIIAYPLANFFVPDAGVGIFLLAAMPSAMSAPLFASLAGGSIELALVLSVFTSLLAPFTIPFVAAITFGSGIDIAPLKMLTDLLLIVFPPMILAQIVRKFFHPHIEPASFALKPLSILLLGLITTGIIAKNAADIFASFTIELLPLFWVVLIFAVITHGVGYLIGIGKSHADKVAYAISLAYMNIVLAIYLAGRFFPHPKTILTTIIALLFWTVLFAAFRTIALKMAAIKTKSS
ncbi:bile acid:sodium symporter [Candidatus Uhrbacteria bacterium]|nr:bile acid:sodium symporter [Candidatus Uhrbacteria bacterium]